MGTVQGSPRGKAREIFRSGTSAWKHSVRRVLGVTPTSLVPGSSPSCTCLLPRVPVLRRDPVAVELQEPDEQ
jgi:hypothetical protein